MKMWWIGLLAVLILITGTACTVVPKEPLPNKEEDVMLETREVLNKDATYRVLMIGNSYTYYNELWDLLKEVAAGAGYTVEVDHVTEGGYYLEQHADVTDPFGIQVKGKMSANDYDFVILQEQSTCPFKDYARFEAAVKDLAGRAENNGATCVLYQTWAREPGSPALTSLGETNESMTQALVRAYDTAAQAVGAEVSPVGAAFFNVVTNHPSVDLYDPDTTHPSLEGSYLAALCHFATLTGEDPRVTTYSPVIDAQTAETLRQVAFETVFGE